MPRHARLIRRAQTQGLDDWRSAVVKQVVTEIAQKGALVHRRNPGITSPVLRNHHWDVTFIEVEEAPNVIDQSYGAGDLVVQSLVKLLPERVSRARVVAHQLQRDNDIGGWDLEKVDQFSGIAYEDRP
jgi:hypothetical protein